MFKLLQGYQTNGNAKSICFPRSKLCIVEKKDRNRYAVHIYDYLIEYDAKSFELWLRYAKLANALLILRCS